jgi:hypothetical protein
MVGVAYRMVFWVARPRRTVSLFRMSEERFALIFRVTEVGPGGH